MLCGLVPGSSLTLDRSEIPLSLCPGYLHVCVCVSAFPSEGTD